MNGGPRIIPIEANQPETGGHGLALDREQAETALPITPSLQEFADQSEDAFDDAATGSPAPWPWALAGGLIAVWTGFFAWASVPGLVAVRSPAAWAAATGQWAAPVLVVLVTLLLIQRGSGREARRFSSIASGLSRESAQLHQQLGAINTELALARDFIAAQARDLDALGRVAADRLSTHADSLRGLIQDNGAQVNAIADVAANALDNMEKLRSQLPVIANSAKDVTNSIANAGRTAHVQLEDMVAGFQRLNEFGLASERQVASVRDQVQTALGALTAAGVDLARQTEARFATLEEEVSSHRAALDQEEHAALAAIRARAQALADTLGEQRRTMASAERESLAALEQRLATLKEASATLGEAVAEQESAALASWQARSEAQMRTLRAALDDLTAAQDSTQAQAQTRLARFAEESRALVAALDAEGEAIDAAVAQRRAALAAGADDQRETLARRMVEIDRAIAERRSALAAAANEATEALAHKLADLDRALDTQRTRQHDEARRLAAQCDAAAARAAELAETLSASASMGDTTAQAVARALDLLRTRLAETGIELTTQDDHIARTTDAAVRLLELIQAAGQHSRNELPEILRTSQAGLAELDQRVTALHAELGEAGNKGTALAETVRGASADIAEALAHVARLHEAFAQQAAAERAQLNEVRATLETARGEAEALSGDITGTMATAIDRLNAAARAAGDTMGETLKDEIEALAARLGEEGNAAFARVLQGRGAELIARLEQAIDNAADASRDSAVQMRDQLAKVDELATNLENRVARARERAEEQVDNDFARRTALITESLNSAAIDIAQALSADVSETAWASYLRGDRGIFTRRAVTLLDSADAKAVQQHYAGDAEFRGHVNRYIHDFEGMLRQLLSTRDGNALGVTLLSSDMGKLYVALAQGIERLRA
ncbi:hypothetical protein IP65_04540 [Novosphingobium sp. AAP1]|uniref:hypothetical protein n=1 Tax=Novosphingobium sp. AAP1 TaxID=1523413 RepID=UPI0006B92436|nr:hypothetical protein [Novosphingobium sp. AAP1]KPF55397.1 hypothetical protein IP65_04540 [Novosphingobium sp. AAP1]